MIRNDLKKLNDKEVEALVMPTRTFILNYISDYIIDDIVAMDIANRINNDALWNDDFKTIVASTIEEIFYQLSIKDCDLKNIKQILKEQYGFEVIKDNPFKVSESIKGN